MTISIVYTAALDRSNTVEHTRVSTLPGNPTEFPSNRVIPTKELFNLLIFPEARTLWKFVSIS
jgi:hypothetical protein